MMKRYAISYLFIQQLQNHGKSNHSVIESTNTDTDTDIGHDTSTPIIIRENYIIFSVIITVGVGHGHRDTPNPGVSPS